MADGLRSGAGGKADAQAVPDAPRPGNSGLTGQLRRLPALLVLLVLLVLG